MTTQWENDEEIQMFREYLQIPSVQPDVDYTQCVDFLKRQAQNLELPLNVYYPSGPTKPVVVISWIGQQPDLPAILLNSHMDVVPVFPEKWTHPPFAAEIDREGKIYARGTQDMKCVGMQYLAAIRDLKRSGVSLKRTLHVSYMPDEEIGGHLGMDVFVKTKDFEKLNIGFSLDEGVAEIDDTYTIYYAERSIWQMNFTFTGTAGHGSLLLKNTVGKKFHYFLDKMTEFRDKEEKRLADNPNLTIGDVTTVNLTKVKAGVQSNVVPPLLEATFDVRLAITVDHVAFENQLRRWCEEAGGGIEISFEQKEPKVPATKLDDSNVFWLAFKRSIDELNVKFSSLVFPGATDSRFVRNVGIPAIGFSPINNTPILAHDHDEYIKAETYLRGIEFYKKIIPNIANA